MKKILLSIFFLLCSVTPSFAKDIERYVLDNGMVILLKEIPESPVVAFHAVLKSGSATEGNYLGCGISHFIEHLMFKGTEKRAVGEVSREAKALGGIINASTSFDYTSYSLELPEGSFSQGLDIISDMLMNSKFDPEQVEKEREVIIGEMRMYRDHPDRYLNDLVFSKVYTTHPYKHPIIGYEQLFRSVTRDQLYQYYKDIYIPNNMILSISGNLKTKEALDDIKEAFKNFKSKPYLTRNLPPEPPQLLAREYEEEYATDLMRLSLDYQGVSMNDPDTFAMDLLAMILGQGESSRLYNSLFKQQGLVYSISADNFTPVDRGIFEISASLDAQKKNMVIGAIKNEIERVKKGGVSDDELKKAKRIILSRYFFNHQKAADIGVDAAMNEALLGDHNFNKKYVEAVKSLTSTDIKRVANKYLVENALSTNSLRPKGQVQDSQTSAPVDKPEDIQKITLDNGMILLLREDRSFPLVSVRLVLQGGLRQEPDDKGGLANLTANLWMRGTKTLSAENISKSTEEKGISFGTFSGQNSFGISADLMSSDLDFVLNLIEDLVKNPTFSDSELIKEKEQVTRDILARKDDVYRSTVLAFRETLFEKHPYRKDVLGSLESIEKIDRNDVAEFYGQWSAPNNMVLSIFGDFKSQNVLKVLRNKFGGLKQKTISLDNIAEPPIDKPRTKDMVLDKSQAVALIGFQGPGIAHKDRYGLEILTNIMGSPLSGRIFTKVRDDLGQSYRQGGNFTPGIGIGMVYFFVVTTPEQVEKVKDILISQIEDLKKNPVSDMELKDAKSFLKGTFKMGMETNDAFASMATFDELYGLGFDNYSRYVASIDQVSKEDLKRLANSYFDSNKLVTVITNKK